MAWRKLTAEVSTGGLVAAAVAPLLGLPIGAIAAAVAAYPTLAPGVTPMTPPGPERVNFSPWGRLQLARATPRAGVLTRVVHDGGEVTLRGRASPGQRMENPGDRLRVPARSNAHIGFRPTTGSGTIPNYLVRAGSDTRDSEYWYPCNGRRGQFLIGWSAGSGTPTCSQVRMGQPFRAPVRGSKALSPTNRLKASFSDTQGHWAEVEIEALSDLGMIAGYEDGSFRPDAPVTRAEFAALVNKAFSDRAPIRPEQDFPDSIDHWARAALRQAYALGFISGYDDGLVQPQGNIRRVEAVVALASGLGLTGEDNLGEFYRDADQIPPWARRQVGAATDQGIRIQGPNPDRFYPDQRASRADVAVFLYQALQENGQTGHIILEPATPEAAWALVEASDYSVDVKVLGGVISVGPDGASQRQRLSAGERYQLAWTRQGVGQGKGPIYGPLSLEERRAIANSPEITTFLDPNSWLPEMASQLGPYQTYREALLKETITPDPNPNPADPSLPPDPNSNQGALSDLAGRLIELFPGLPDLNASQPSSPPDLSVSQIDFTLLNRRSAVAGQVQILGRVENLGGPYRSNPGQQRALLYEVSPGGGRQLVASADFDSLMAPNTIELTYTRDWQAAAAEGGSPPSYELILSFDPRLDQDGNPSNDDSNPRNHQLMRSGSEINALFR